RIVFMQDVSFLSHFTWLDGLIVVVLGFYAVEGYALGAVLACFDLVKFLVSFLVGLKGYSLIALLLTQGLGISKGYANALGFFVVAALTEAIMQYLLRNIVKKVNTSGFINKSYFPKVNNFLGILPGVLSGGVLVMFLLTVIITLPVSPFLKSLISKSELGTFFISNTQSIEKDIAGAFGGAANETLNFLTVEPQSNSLVNLGFHTDKGTIDAQSEQQMLTMVNTQREKNGKDDLTMDTRLQKLARDYAQEMLSRGYFSHYTPEGLSPFDRMSQQDIIYTYAGENLAFSANVQLAMQGLMNSPGHRANILSGNFKRVGIGVIDAGIYGEMFVQEFTD
ncbi:MAG TPA: CvpA family protein, partial [Patescibacteria group bacterium]|nr:CvpA family protein [Patescibacteria group bacterium]